MNKNIWVIEDNIEVHNIIKTCFDKHDHRFTFFSNVSDYLKCFKSTIEKPDLLLVDLELKEGIVFDLLKDRKHIITCPFIVISGHLSHDFISSSYKHHALDFISKPFIFNELEVKVNLQLEKIEKREKKNKEIINKLKIDTTKFTRKEIKIIEAFNTQDDKILHRDDIFNEVWRDTFTNANTLDVHLYNLRKKLQDHNFTIKSKGSGNFQFQDL